jgi:hypothetical protein
MGNLLDISFNFMLILRLMMMTTQRRGLSLLDRISGLWMMDAEAIEVLPMGIFELFLQTSFDEGSFY